MECTGKTDFCFGRRSLSSYPDLQLGGRGQLVTKSDEVDFGYESREGYELGYPRLHTIPEFIMNSISYYT